MKEKAILLFVLVLACAGPYLIMYPIYMIVRAVWVVTFKH